MALPLEAEFRRLDHQMDHLVAGFGQSELLRQEAEVCDLAIRAAVLVQKGQVDHSLRWLQGDRRPRMDFVVERSAQRMFFE